MAISDDDGYFVCDYCGDDTGKFNAETGNHESCEELAKLRVELAALRRVAEAARELIHAEDDNTINHKYSTLVSSVYEYDECVK